MRPPASLHLPCLLFLAACPSAAPGPSDAPALVGDGVFAEGCPEPGRALARPIAVDGSLPGDAAVGGAGDFLLANGHAAFVITGLGPQSTYWYYPGALADAAPVEDCVASPDKLDELALVLLDPDLGEFSSSNLRAFRADSVEVLSDGADGGPAVVRARGDDAIHWLVEHTLIKEAARSGGRDYSEPFGVAVTVDYVLEPDSPVLRLDVTVENVGEESVSLFDAALFQHGATLDPVAFASRRVSLAGLDLDAGIPWLLASDGQGAYAFGAPEGNLATITFSGVQAIVDLSQLSEGFQLSPGRSETLSRYLAVGDRGGAEAVEALLTAVPEPIRGNPAVPRRVEVQLVDGAGLGQRAEVALEARASEGDWGLLTRELSDEDGRAWVTLPDFTEPFELRLVPQGPGRDRGEPVVVQPGAGEVELTLAPSGQLAYDLRADGEASPARLELRREDGRRVRLWVQGEGTTELPPGRWSWTATRGYEFEPDSGEFELPEGGSVQLDASLSRAFPTDGWLSVDTHVHSADSPDSRTLPEVGLQHAAAHGLDLVIRTEHEHIVDRPTLAADSGVQAWTNHLTGEEVTSVAVEHMTMFPVEADGSPRGGYVEWYGMDIAQLLAAMRERSGGGINLINHPGWLDEIQWDRFTASPGLGDPTLLGFAPDAPLWSWDVDGIEVMASHGNIFADGNRRFDNWMSMLNAGRRMIAVGCSDDHGGNSVGFPRTYVAVPDDDPAALDVDAVVEAFRGGRGIASAGAFAEVSVAGQGPGGQVTDTDGEVELQVKLSGMAAADVTHFVVFANCDQVAAVAASDPEGAVKFDGAVTVPVAGDSHLVVAAFGAQSLPPGLPQYDAARTPRVLTNPIWIDADGDGQITAPGGRECAYTLELGGG